MPEFKVHSEFEMMGDQPQAVEKIAESIESGNRFQTLLGVTGSGKTYTMAKIIEKVQKPTLIISHNKTLAAQLHGEMKEFFPDNAVEYFVSYYDFYQPEAYVASTDTYIEKDADINDEIDKLRHSATAAVLERRDVIIVASVSCIYGLGSPDSYRNQLLSLRPGMEMDRTMMMRKLIDMQYERNDIDFHRGTFRVRGDIIDIYPAIAVFIIKAGIDMLRENISKILGERADSRLTKEIKDTILEIDGISGAYDLLLHSYGPNTVIGEVHIEVPDTFTAATIDEMTRQIQEKVYNKYGIAIATVGVYSMNTTDDKALRIKSDITRLVMSEEFVLQMHGFYLDEEKMLMLFDIIVDFDAPDRMQVRDNILNKIKSKYPEYEVKITIDLDVSD